MKIVFVSILAMLMVSDYYIFVQSNQNWEEAKCVWWALRWYQIVNFFVEFKKYSTKMPAISRTRNPYWAALSHLHPRSSTSCTQLTLDIDTKSSCRRKKNETCKTHHLYSHPLLLKRFYFYLHAILFEFDAKSAVVYIPERFLCAYLSTFLCAERSIVKCPVNI